MNQSCSQERSNCNLKQQANLLSSCIPPKFELPKYAANCQFNGYEGYYGGGLPSNSSGAYKPTSTSQNMMTVVEMSSQKQASHHALAAAAAVGGGGGLTSKLSVQTRPPASSLLHSISDNRISSMTSSAASDVAARGWPVTVNELQPAFDIASEDGYSSSDYYRSNFPTNGLLNDSSSMGVVKLTSVNGGPPVPPRSKPPTPPPYNTAVKRGMSPVHSNSNAPRCAGQCQCPYCPIKNGISPSLWAMLLANSGVDPFVPVTKQPRGDFTASGACGDSSASNSPRNSLLFGRGDGALSDTSSVRSHSIHSQPLPSTNAITGGSGGGVIPIIRDKAPRCQSVEENFRAMSPSSSEMSSSIFSDSHSEYYGVPLPSTNPSAGNDVSASAMPNSNSNLTGGSSDNAVYPCLPSKPPPPYMKPSSKNTDYNGRLGGSSNQHSPKKRSPPPIPPKKAPPPYAPPPPPGAMIAGNSRRLPTPENGSGSISSGGRNSRNEDSHDELNSTLKNSLSSNSLAPLRKLTNDVSEIVAASKEEELRAQLESALNKSAIALNVDDSSPGGPNGMDLGNTQSEASPRSDNSGALHQSSRTAGGDQLAQQQVPCALGSSSCSKAQNRRHSAIISNQSAKNTKKYSSNAFKFYMEQHMENVINFPLQREKRRHQIEKQSSNLPVNEKAEVLQNFNKCESELLRRRRTKITVESFKHVDQLGIGGFGEVKLVRYCENNQLYAMKVLNKAHILKKNQAGHVRAERDILAEADNEWVVKLFYSFQDKCNLYLVMEYIPGGDLMSLLIKKDIFSEPMARFYTAEMILAIESVHELGFIHRDIKPDNILIDRNGHIKLTDFGLCTGFRWTHGQLRDPSYEMDDEEWEKLVEKQCSCCNDSSRTDTLSSSDPASEGSKSGQGNCKPLNKYRRLQRHRCFAHSLVGTPNYIAPELLMKVPYTKSCDWWSVGVILYEMVLGRPPFCADTPADTQYRVLHWKKYLQIPHNWAQISQISSECVDFIIKVCRDQASRLGSKDVADLKNHPFLKDVPFEQLRSCKAPHIPELRHEIDTQHFQNDDGHLLTKPVNDSDYQPDHTLKHPDHAFYEFTYRRPVANLSSYADFNGSTCKVSKSRTYAGGLSSKLFKSSSNVNESGSKDVEMEETDARHSTQKSGAGSMARKLLNGLRSFKSSESLDDLNDQTFISNGSQNTTKSGSSRKELKQKRTSRHRHHSSELAMEIEMSSSNLTVSSNMGAKSNNYNDLRGASNNSAMMNKYGGYTSNAQQLVNDLQIDVTNGANGSNSARSSSKFQQQNIPVTSMMTSNNPNRSQQVHPRYNLGQNHNTNSPLVADLDSKVSEYSCNNARNEFLQSLPKQYNLIPSSQQQPPSQSQYPGASPRGVVHQSRDFAEQSLNNTFASFELSDDDDECYV